MLVPEDEIQNFKEEEERLEFKWKVIYHDQDIIQFRIDPKNHEKISYDGVDRLVVRVKDTKFLIGSQTFLNVVFENISDKTCNFDERTQCSNLPPYVSDIEKASAVTSGQVMDFSIKAIIGMNIIFYFIGGSALMYFWGLLRGLQLINNLNLIQTPYSEGFP